MSITLFLHHMRRRHVLARPVQRRNGHQMKLPGAYSVALD